VNILRHLAILALAVSACDDLGANACPEPEPAALVIAPPLAADPPDQLAFREQGPPHAHCIETWNGAPIHAKQFADAVTVCAKVGDPQLLLTLSDYDPDVAKPDDRVVGVGGSMIASDELFGCLFKRWTYNDAVELP